MTANGSPEGPQPDTANADAAAAAEGDEQEPQSPIAIIAQYIKDLSFEVPSAPGIFAEMQNEQPEISVNIDVKANPIQESVFEIVLHIEAQCKIGESSAFVCELAYGGLFAVTVPAEHLQAILLIECPRLLFPFARNIVADATRDGGFPPLMLAPVDFVSMYQNQIAQQAAQQQQPEGPSSPIV
ncbi:MAG: protein-export chaperone SecB [Rhodospirillales bacterium]|nr:protein-export chaperone SecB [Rhodospirillales bacterium]